eukprot:Hpha_TRINITY_DN9514_c0_g1::TRINITY_DN9514_c0_g1_i1::g.114892::m.114892/K19603/MAPK15; mitogen-activated protein kinase 15
MESGIDQRVLRKYRIHGKPVGQGSYGTVWKATRVKSKDGSGEGGHLYALKKCHEPFRNGHDAQGMFREVMILRALKHENIVRLKEVIRDSADKDLYLVFEFVETTVARTIEGGGLTDKHRACIMHQLLNAVQYIHSAELVHRDIKPANLLISASCQLRIADFGEARSLLSEHEVPDDYFPASSPGGIFVPPEAQGAMTECGFTLWYNAPEVVAGSSTYGKAVDIWSCGCVMGELMSRHRRPIFCGTSNVDQLSRHVAMVGLPNGESDIECLQASKAQFMMRSVHRSKESRLEEYFVDADPSALDLLSKMLKFNPTLRMPARDCLTHSFLSEFHDPRKERPRDGPVLVEFDGLSKLTKEQYQEALYTRVGLGGSMGGQSPGMGMSNMTTGSVDNNSMGEPGTRMSTGQMSAGDRSRQCTQLSSSGAIDSVAPTASSSNYAKPGGGAGVSDRLLSKKPEDDPGGGCCCLIQ